MKYKKEIIFSAAILFIFGFLVFLENTLPNFVRFFPVQENKLLVIVLNINVLLILLLLFLITRILLKSYIENKKGIWGSGLKKRLTTALLIISVVPSFTLFILITGFFNANIDKWFGQRVEDTLENALTLSQFHYEDIFRQYDKITERAAREIVGRKLLGNEAGLRDYMRRNENTYFLEYQSVHDLMANAVVKLEGADDIDEQLTNKIKETVSNGKLEEIIPVSDGEMIIMGRPIFDAAGHAVAVLFIGDKMNVKGTERINQIASVRKEVRESRVMRKVLKYSFILPLFLVTILTVFFSLWMGVKMAGEITGPIEKVKEGADIVAKGKFDINLEVKGRDEIGTLVRAFNSMAEELQIAKDEIEERRRYMEVILDNVATGIVSTDKKGYILLLNRAAKDILGIEDYRWQETHLKDVFGDSFKTLTKMFLKDVKRSGGDRITKELRLNIKKDTTYLRTSLTVLKDESGKTEGFIIAFDDITHIVRAEKLATWREAARRLTHEIKNPLTPIVLSAERIRRKIMARFQGDERGILDETTSVIIRSVDDIKGIVNELTRLTHISQTKTVEDLNVIIMETLDLYKSLYRNITFSADRGVVPLFRMDKDGLKRAFINLITNSVKAMEGNEGTISVLTRYEKARSVVVIEFADTGKGIAREDREKVFYPYFTKDKDGTGLGLAIVHSVVLEHHGKIHVEDNIPRGTKFVIELPIVET